MWLCSSGAPLTRHRSYQDADPRSQTTGRPKLMAPIGPVCSSCHQVAIVMCHKKRCECFIFGRSRIVDMLNVNKKQQFVAQVISPKVACSAGELSLKWRKNSRNTRVNVCDANCKCVDQGTEEIRSLWRHGLRHNYVVRSVLFILRLQQGCSRKCLAYAWM